MKTKVVAFRVTQQEYDALAFVSAKRLMSVGEFVNNYLANAKWEAVEAFRKEQKRLEAKAKRDAKKAAANGVQ